MDNIWEEFLGNNFTKDEKIDNKEIFKLEGIEQLNAFDPRKVHMDGVHNISSILSIENPYVQDTVTIEDIENEIIKNEDSKPVENDIMGLLDSLEDFNDIYHKEKAYEAPDTTHLELAKQNEHGEYSVAKKGEIEYPCIVVKNADSDSQVSNILSDYIYKGDTPLYIKRENKLIRITKVSLTPLNIFRLKNIICGSDIIQLDKVNNEVIKKIVTEDDFISEISFEDII